MGHFHSFNQTRAEVFAEFGKDFKDLDFIESIPQPPTHPHTHHHLHHPNCNFNSSVEANSPAQRSDSASPKDDDFVDTPYLTPEAFRATEAIEFIAEHLRSEDEYIQVCSVASFDPLLSLLSVFGVQILTRTSLFAYM